MSELRIIAEEAPRSGDVLPVMIEPSLSSIAAAGPPVSSARTLAAATTGLSEIETPALFIIPLIFST